LNVYSSDNHREFDTGIGEKREGGGKEGKEGKEGGRKFSCCIVSIPAHWRRVGARGERCHVPGGSPVLSC
jgi:hypothetical protein